MPVWQDSSEITSDMVHELDAYWHKRALGNTPPPRDSIDPVDLRHLLPNIVIVDFEGANSEVRYRLVGTKVVEMSRIDFTGRLLHELECQAAEMDIWGTAYREIVKTRRPVYGRVEIPMTYTSEKIVQEEFGIFPLTLDGEGIQQCIAIEDYGPSDPSLNPENLRPMRVR